MYYVLNFLLQMNSLELTRGTVYKNKKVRLSIRHSAYMLYITSAFFLIYLFIFNIHQFVRFYT